MHVNLGTFSIGTAEGQAGRKETSRLYSKENLVPSPQLHTQERVRRGRPCPAWLPSHLGSLWGQEVSQEGGERRA